jgi:hypothetical protein
LLGLVDCAKDGAGIDLGCGDRPLYGFVNLDTVGIAPLAVRCPSAALLVTFALR